MIRCLAVAVAVAFAGCADGSSSAPPAPAPAPAPIAPPTPPPAPPEPEPSRITVQHVLIAFAGAARSTETRSKDEAQKLAIDILDRAKKGEGIEALAKQYSSDPGGGKYTLVNTGVAAKGNEIPRQQFIKPFVDVAFKLKVGDVGLVEYDPTKGADGRPRSPFGWHVIKRLE
jgi:parvulin-like peptidyl-prolyl isomerase